MFLVQQTESEHYTKDRRENILVLLFQYNVPVPVAVVVKLLAYESRTGALAPLSGLVQDGQVSVTYPCYFNPTEPFYSITRLGSRAAAALVAGARIQALRLSKHDHVLRLLERHTIFQFDVTIGELLCQKLPGEGFSTSDFAAAFQAFAVALQVQYSQGKLTTVVVPNVLDVLQLTGKHRVHGNRRTTVVYAHNILKTLVIQTRLRQMSTKFWVLQ